MISSLQMVEHQWVEHLCDRQRDHQCNLIVLFAYHHHWLKTHTMQPARVPSLRAHNHEHLQLLAVSPTVETIAAQHIGKRFVSCLELFAL